MEFHDGFETPCREVHRTSIASGGEPAALCAEGADHIDLWYTGPGNRVHYGRSEDGISFDSRPTDLPAGCLRSAVLERDGVYYLYCADRDCRIHLFTSRDRVHFAPQGVALSAGAGGDLYVANAFAWVEGDTWHLLYEAGRDPGPSQWAICLATAPTPTGFSGGRCAGNPVLTAPGPGCGNPELARLGSEVIRHRGRYWMLYHRGENWRAWSTDLRSWTQEGVLWGYDRSDRAGYSCGDASMCQFRGRTYLWKSLSDQVSECWMSVALADMPLAELLDRDVPVSALRWEDAAPDGGYPRFADADPTRARTGKSSLYLGKQYWREPRGVAMRHPCRPGVPVEVCVWYHDDARAEPTRGRVGVAHVDDTATVAIGIDTDVSATHYLRSGRGRPAATAVPRAPGWHEFRFLVGRDGTEVWVDGTRTGLSAAVCAETLGSVVLCSDAERPLRGSVDSVTIRRQTAP
ncbi:MAG: hypothetical protein AB1505_25375 [Candidatus Latescibacterota bacterium]